MTDSGGYWLDQNETMHSCWRWAWDVFQAEGILSHERVAYELGSFVRDRIAQQPDTPETAALLDIVAMSTMIATYLSSGPRPIRQALAMLARLALPYQDHPDYKQEWKP